MSVINLNYTALFAKFLMKNCQKWLLSLQPLPIQLTLRKYFESKTIICSSIQSCASSKVFEAILKKLTARIHHCFYYKLFSTGCKD